MTAVNVLIEADQVHLFADGLACEGGRRYSVSKIRALPHLRLALATRGTIAHLDLATRLLSENAGNYDDARQVAAQLRSLTEKGHPEPYLDRALRMDFDLVVVGIGKDGPSGLIVSNHAANGIAPWAVADIEHALLTPQVPAELFDRLAKADERFPVMVDAMEAQCRAHPDQIGRFCEVVTVAQNAVLSAVIRRWPDPATAYRASIAGWDGTMTPPKLPGT